MKRATTGDLSMTVADALKTAIYNEKLAADYYDSLADICAKARNAKVANFFRKQALREKGHFNRLSKLMHKRNYDKSPAVGEIVKWINPETGAGESVPAHISLDGALKQIEDNEAAALSFYREYSSKIADPEVSDLFIKLAREEAKHVYLSQKTRLRFERKGLVEEPDYMDLGFQ